MRHGQDRYFAGKTTFTVRLSGPLPGVLGLRLDQTRDVVSGPKCASTSYDSNLNRLETDSYITINAGQVLL